MKFHIRKDYVADECSASEKACPLESPHFKTFEEADKKAQEMATLIYGSMKVMQKEKGGATMKKEIVFDRGTLAVKFETKDVKKFMDEFSREVGFETYQNMRNNAINRYVNAHVNSLKKADQEAITDYGRKQFFYEYADKFHMTVMLPSVIRNLSKNKVKFSELLEDVNTNCEVDFVGLGSVSEILKTGEKNRAYYVVCNSFTIDRMLESLNLEKQNLHITLGFDVSDIHNQAKDASTLISK